MPGFTNALLERALIAMAVVGVAARAFAADSTLSADRLSVLQDPLAVEIGDTTLVLRGSLEETAKLNLNTDKVFAGTHAGVELSAQTQLSNQLRLRLSYAGVYDTKPGRIADLGGVEPKRYDDRAILSLRGVWGELRGGSTTGIVEEQTERMQPVGKAVLAFDGMLGSLDDWGVGYAGRHGPAVLSMELDRDGDGVAGLRWSRPIGNKDIGFAIRGALGTFVAEDRSVTFDSYGFTALADIIYGSSQIDLTIGLEHLRAGSVGAERYYASLGLQHKIGSMSVSAHAHYGILDGNDEISFAFGGRYDIARGLSANIGLNYARLHATMDGINVASKDEVEAAASLRYEF